MNQLDDHLWIADIQAVRERPTDRFAHIVTVCQDDVSENVSDECTYTHVNLADGTTESHAYGGDCGMDTFREGVDAVVTGLDAGEDTLVHCHAAVSRSSAVAITALAIHHDEPYDEAYNRVADAHPIMNPHPHLAWCARKVLDDVGVGPHLTVSDE